MVSSRKQENVDRAVKQLRSEPGNLTVEGVVCHVGKPEHRKRLIQEVDGKNYYFSSLNRFYSQTVSRFGSLDILVSNAAVNPMNSGQPGTIHVSVIYKLKFIFKDLPAPFSTLQTPESVWDKVRSLCMQSFFYPYLNSSSNVQRFCKIKNTHDATIITIALWVGNLLS